MPSSSNSDNLENEIEPGLRLRKLLILLNQVIAAIGEFKNKYDKKFNFTGLIKHLNLPETETEGILSLILNFQEIFEDVFKNHRLERKNVGGKVYFIAIEKELRLTEEQARQISDIVYMFKRIKKGEGFDLNLNNSKLITNIKILRKQHSCLFKSNGSNKAYPSELCQKMGDTLLSCYKFNKKVESFTINNYRIVVM